MIFVYVLIFMFQLMVDVTFTDVAIDYIDSTTNMHQTTDAIVSILFIILDLAIFVDQLSHPTLNLNFVITLAQISSISLLASKMEINAMKRRI